MSISHDLVTKDILTHREMAIAFLKAHMPKMLVELVDWRTVKLDSANVEHVRQGNKDNIKTKEQSDLAFLFKLKNGQLGAALVHIEAQTSDDITFILRVRHYQSSFLLDFIKKNKGIKKLPLIFSLLLYADKKPFKQSLDIYDYFENRELAKEYAFTNQLIDLGNLSDEEILEHGDIAGFELILKHIRQGNIDGNLNIVSKYLVTYNETITQTLIKYMSRHSELKYRSFCDRILNVEPNLENTMKTVAEQLEEMGLEKGLEQGIEQGAVQKAQETARNMLTDNMSVAIVCKYTGLERKTVLSIQKDLNKKSR
ncbi:Rpn family recombination-promoting nuclease/putative transposase [Thiotrichales bacterium 19S11-10]|nr:Rpn family recombination-promoting nuclease/putative transposase [Thiotrichales bacterium 19S11-10]